MSTPTNSAHRTATTPAPLRLDIGPLRVRVDLDATLTAHVPAAWHDARVRTSDEPTERIRLTAGPVLPPAALASPEVFTSGASRSLLRSSACRLERRRDVRGGRDVTITGTCIATPHALTRALRFATQPSLLDRRRLLLHASSVVLDDGAHVFVAASGTGKSTLARRLVDAGAKLLGDEVALLGDGLAEVHPGQMLHGTPGDFAPLAAIHLLDRGAPSSEVVRQARAASTLLEAAMVYENGAGALERALAIVADLLATVPVLKTTVPDSDDALSLFESVLPGHPPQEGAR